MRPTRTSNPAPAKPALELGRRRSPVPLTGRLELEKEVAKTTAKFALGEILRPSFWSGYRVVPTRIEFWRERPFRLHERRVFVRLSGQWTLEELYP